MTMGIIQEIPTKLRDTVEKSFAPGEAAIFQLKGAFKEALVCTDRRVIIAKSGFMTGQIFGSDLFQLSYASVATAQVKMHLLTGYFEVSAGGMQNTEKSYWAKSGLRNAAGQPNSIALNSRAQAEQFRLAASFIMERSNGVRSASVAPMVVSERIDISAELEKLWSLKERGALTQQEYDDAKAKLVGAPVSETNAVAAGFNVILMACGRDKIGAMKIFRDVAGGSVADAKRAVETAPTLVLTGASEYYAQRVKAEFSRIGAIIEISPVSATGA